MQKIKAKAILFDKDGTLLEFDPFWIAVSEFAVEQILTEYSLSQSYFRGLFKSQIRYRGLHQGGRNVRWRRGS